MLRVELTPLVQVANAQLNERDGQRAFRNSEFAYTFIKDSESVAWQKICRAAWSRPGLGATQATNTYH